MKITFGTIYQRGKNNIWWWEYREDGERKYRSLETDKKGEALARRKFLHLQLSAETITETVPLDEIEMRSLTSYKASCRPGTVKVVLRAIQSFTKHCKAPTLSQVDRPQIDAWVVGMRGEKFKGATINLYIRYMRAVTKRIAPRLPNPFAEYPRLREDDSREVVALEPALVGAYLEAARQEGHPAYEELLFMATTGARESSLRLVRVRDINLEDGTITITLWKTMRSREDRNTVVPIHQDLLPAILRRMDGKDPDALLFPERARQGRLGADMIVLARRHGLKHAHPHQLRHTFATEALRATGDIHGVMATMGWRSIEMAQRYLTSNVKARRAIVDSISYTTPNQEVPNAGTAAD